MRYSKLTLAIDLLLITAGCLLALLMFEGCLGSCSASNPSQLGPPIAEDSFALLEVNTCYDLDANDELIVSYKQLIFWRNRDEIGRSGRQSPVLRAAGYKMMHFGSPVSIVHRDGKVVAAWTDKDVRHKVTAPMLIETHTGREYDPELLDKRIRPCGLDAPRGLNRWHGRDNAG